MIKKPKPSRLSIIIPALNEEKYINQCLEAIMKMDTVNMDLEIVVVDNGSTDKTIEICESYGARVLIEREGTIASLRNYGAINSKGDLISFLDADCIVSKDWLSKALEYIRDKERIVIGFRLSIPENSNWVAKCWDLLFTKRNTTIEVDWVPSGNMIMKREAFVSINGFDETLESNEDYDFCFRIRNQGYKIISCSDTSVTHLRPPQNLAKIFQKELWHGKEVLKVFIDDIKQSRDLFIFRRKNFKVILYAFFYLICLLLLLFSLVLAFSHKTFLPLSMALIFPIVVSFFLALKYTQSIKRVNMVFGLTFLLITYGFSRAISLLPYKRIKEWIIETKL